MQAAERDQIKANYGELRSIAAQHRNGQFPIPNPQSALDVSEEERNRIYEKHWQQGGLAFMGSFNDLIFNDKSNRTAADFIRNKITQIVKDPETARILSPITKIGCKRLCADTHYYDTYNLAHVSVVDIKQRPIEPINANGITCDGKQAEFDAILATGYDAMTDSLLRMNVSGRDGISLSDAWREGPKTYLGLACHGFPNLFTITGPGSPSVLTNMLPSIEQHVNLISDVLSHAKTNHSQRVEAQALAQQAWVDQANIVTEKTLHLGCNSWYLGANIPGKLRVFMPYVGFADYVKKCDEIAGNNHEGFSFL
ncbi:MAG: cation diffusion facilitator CzcD-associated flavoprotein CzcO [Saprospiraceae bacterium]|jgi:cation diffusion facilitator CzcD-associated flavoprotein CzcO